MWVVSTGRDFIVVIDSFYLVAAGATISFCNRRAFLDLLDRFWGCAFCSSLSILSVLHCPLR